jgi:hypothetical protein
MMQKIWMTGLVIALAAFGCDDDSSNKVPLTGQDSGAGGATGGAGGGDNTPTGGTPAPSGGEAPTGGTPAPTGGEADPDGAAPDPDAGITPDAAAPDPDMNVTPADAAPPPELDAGAECNEGEGPEICGDYRQCVTGRCRVDMRPGVYKMTNAVIAQPAEAGAVLQVALLTAAATNSLNLLFEPGPYTEDGQQKVFMGNGFEDQQTYSFIHTLPIQNYLGAWRAGEEGPVWTQDGNQEFLLNVPSGFAEDENGAEVRCFVRFPSTIRMELWPDELDGETILRGHGSGFLRRADAELVDFTFNGTTFRLIEMLANDQVTIDSDGDGELDAYAFDLEIEATPVVFTDDPVSEDGANRDPNPPFEPHPACD